MPTMSNRINCCRSMPTTAVGNDSAYFVLSPKKERDLAAFVTIFFSFLPAKPLFEQTNQKERESSLPAEFLSALLGVLSFSPGNRVCMHPNRSFGSM